MLPRKGRRQSCQQITLDRRSCDCICVLLLLTRNDINAAPSQLLFASALSFPRSSASSCNTQSKTPSRDGGKNVTLQRSACPPLTKCVRPTAWAVLSSRMATSAASRCRPVSSAPECPANMSQSESRGSVAVCERDKKSAGHRDVRVDNGSTPPSSQPARSAMSRAHRLALGQSARREGGCVLRSHLRLT